MLLKFLWGTNPQQFLTEEGWQMKLSLRETLLWYHRKASCVSGIDVRMMFALLLSFKFWILLHILLIFLFVFFTISLFAVFHSPCLPLLFSSGHSLFNFGSHISLCVFFLLPVFCPFPFVIPNFSTLISFAYIDVVHSCFFFLSLVFRDF